MSKPKARRSQSSRRTGTFSRSSTPSRLEIQTSPKQKGGFEKRE